MMVDPRIWSIKLSFIDRHSIPFTGCDSGFGQGVALQLNKEGFFVFAGCLDANSNQVNEMKKKAQYPSRLVCLQMNVTSDDEVSAVYKKVQEVIADRSDVDKLYAIINNAGIAIPCILEGGGKGCQDVYVKHLEVNTLGVIRVTKTFLPLLRKAKESRVLNVSSMAARSNLPTMNQYAVSKAATSKFTEGIREELEAFGVKAISIEPWFYKTPLTEARHLSSGLMRSFKASSEEVRQAYKDKMDSLVYFLDKTMNSPAVVCEDTHTVFNAITDALTLAEPDLVCRVVPDLKGFILWLTLDMYPWELLHAHKKFLEALRRWFMKSE